MTLDNLSHAYRVLRFGEAVDCYQLALAIYRNTGDRHGEGTALTNLGGTGDRHGEGQALYGLGSAYAGLRQPGWAVECWREAAAAMRDAGDHEAAERLQQAAAQPRRWGLRRRSSS